MKPVVQSAIDKFLIAIVLIGVVVFGVLVWAVFFNGPSAIEDAADECSTSSYVLEPGDDGSTLVVEETDSLETVQCVLDELEAPDSVRAKIASTRAIDGSRSDSWDGYEASWTYHPDAGLRLIIEED